MAELNRTTAQARADDAAALAGSRSNDEAQGVRYHGYRHDPFADALAYARQGHSRPVQPDSGGPFRSGTPCAPPSSEQQSLMAMLGLRYVDGRYGHGDRRYDDLADAVGHAMYAPGRHGDGGR